MLSYSEKASQPELLWEYAVALDESDRPILICTVQILVSGKVVHRGGLVKYFEQTIGEKPGVPYLGRCQISTYQ